MKHVMELFSYLNTLSEGRLEEDVQGHTLMAVLFDLFKIPRPPLDLSTIKPRIDKLAQELRKMPVPCLITICRSNTGGYVSMRDTYVLENLVLAMLKDVFGALPEIQYTNTAFNTSVYKAVQERLDRLHPRPASTQ